MGKPRPREGKGPPCERQVWQNGNTAEALNRRKQGLRAPLTLAGSAAVDMLHFPSLAGNGDSNRSYCTVSPSSSVGSGVHMSWLLPCWWGPSCPSYRKEVVLGQMGTIRTHDCSLKGREEDGCSGALPVSWEPWHVSTWVSVSAPCSTEGVHG